MPIMKGTGLMEKERGKVMRTSLTGAVTEVALRMIKPMAKGK